MSRPIHNTQNSFTDFLHTELNNPQQQAVIHKEGPLLVIAGAGSGKTRVITARIAYLIAHEQCPPSSIIALTFTNKAAREMKDRVAHFLASKENLPFVGTFHSYAVLLLRKYGRLIDLPSFTILDDEDQQNMVNDILKRNNLHKQITPRQALHNISHMKNNLEPFNNPAYAYLYDLFKTYEHEKRITHCLDFDDLLHETLRLFKKNPEFKNQFQERTRHILIDEYQDTNLIQHELLKHMALKDHKLAIDSICAVGDEDQSIYSWRGATITNILNFQRDFGQAPIIKIEQNYRSVKPILDVANEVIQHNTQRTPKHLWSEKSARDRVVQLTCLSEYQEAEIITSIIRAALQRPSAHIAILYRTHAQSRAIEEALVKHAIPYMMIGGVEFYERLEIKDLLAYMRLIVNPLDRQALVRIVNRPTRGLGAQVDEQLRELWQQQPWLPFNDLLKLACSTYQLPPQKTRSLEQFIALFDGLSANDKPSTILELIIQKTQYIPYIRDKYEPEQASARVDNIKELLNAAIYLEQRSTPTADLFLQEIALMQEAVHKESKEKSSVVLMSLHAAKGLEFDTVIITGLEENLLPTARALDNDDAIEEERRLFYVGITRAQEYLFFMHAQYRYIYGQMVAQSPSRFLKELPRSTIMQYDCTAAKPRDLHKIFQGTRPTFGEYSSLSKETSPKPQTNKSTTTSTTTAWKLNQPVMHEKYGIGRITSIEPRSDATYLTIAFKSGTKKIVDQFVRSL